MKQAMKKRPFQLLSTLVLSLALVFALGVQGFAADYPLVNDAVGVLSESEIAALQTKAEEYSATWGQDIVIYITNDLEGKSAMAAADDYFDYNGFGMGSDYAGVIMLIYDNGEGVWISTCGATIDDITDYGIEHILDMVFTKDVDDYYGECDIYLETVNTLLSTAASGDSYDVDNTAGISAPKDTQQILLTAWVSAFVVALVFFIICFMQLRTKRKQHSAKDYVIGDGLDLTHRKDLYLYSNTSRTRKESSSSSGGSSTHRSSSGRSHGGGGRHR